MAHYSFYEFKLAFTGTTDEDLGIIFIHMMTLVTFAAQFIFQSSLMLTKV